MFSVNLYTAEFFYYKMWFTLKIYMRVFILQN